MGIAWSTYKSKREVKAKAKRSRHENCVRIPHSQGISERLPTETFEMKENNLLIEENIYVDENELAASDEWKLLYKSLRPLKDNQYLQQNDVNMNAGNKLL